MWWDWVMDTPPLNTSVKLHLLDNDKFTAATFGDMRILSNLCDNDEQQILFENCKKLFIY